MNRSNHRVATLVAVVCALLASSAAQAQDHPPPWLLRPRPRPVPQVTMQLEDGMGNRLRAFQQGGQSFVLGAPGDRYAVRIHNPTAERVEVVLTIDGRDAVRGLPSDGVSPRGYVIPAGASALVEGFRTSVSAVATFRFSSPADSYAARMGTPQHIGEISLSVFPERRQAPIEIGDMPWRAPDEGERQRPAPPGEAPRAGAARAPSQPWQDGSNLGTEFGEIRSSQVRETSFERATPWAPSRVLSVRYDDAEGLAARGIEVFPSPPVEPWPVLPVAPVNRFSLPPPSRFAEPPPSF